MFEMVPFTFYWSTVAGCSVLYPPVYIAMQIIPGGEFTNCTSIINRVMIFPIPLLSLLPAWCIIHAYYPLLVSVPGHSSLLSLFLPDDSNWYSVRVKWPCPQLLPLSKGGLWEGSHSGIIEARGHLLPRLEFQFGFSSGSQAGTHRLSRVLKHLSVRRKYYRYWEWGKGPQGGLK